MRLLTLGASEVLGPLKFYSSFMRFCVFVGGGGGGEGGEASGFNAEGLMRSYSVYKVASLPPKCFRLCFEGRGLFVVSIVRLGPKPGLQVLGFRV